MDGGMSECFHEAKHDGMIYFSFYMFTHFAYPVDIYRTIKNPVMGGLSWHCKAFMVDGTSRLLHEKKREDGKRWSREEKTF